MQASPICAAALLVLEQAVDGHVVAAPQPRREHSAFAFVASAPFIYALAVPLLLLDAMVSLYQWVCFPIYGVERVARAPYFVFDRARLPFLSALEKANCVYCSYANGLLAYVREVAARTEQYWCPLRNQREPLGVHSRYPAFPTPRDAEELKRKIAELRMALAPRD